jgi:hypothetical protein
MELWGSASFSDLCFCIGLDHATQSRRSMLRGTRIPTACSRAPRLKCNASRLVGNRD